MCVCVFRSESFPRKKLEKARLSKRGWKEDSTGVLSCHVCLANVQEGVSSIKGDSELYRGTKL